MHLKSTQMYVNAPYINTDVCKCTLYQHRCM